MVGRDTLRSQIFRAVKKPVASRQAVEPRIADLLELADKAEKAQFFEEARQALAQAEREAGPESPDYRYIVQRLAFCTYKDKTLPANERFDGALEILGRAESLSTVEDPETLGLAGAIYKNLWRVEGRRSHLERSHFFYARGAEKGAEADNGYTAINASYVLDLLADAENRSARGTGRQSTSAHLHREEAQSIRRDILGALVPRVEDERCDDWWLLATLVEAFFGLGREEPNHYEDACRWIQRSYLWRDGKITGVVPQYLQTTLRQLVALAHAQGVNLHENQRARAVLHLIGDVRAIESAIRGKIGLGLSGGGFRASFFHIGMLARLAELDTLRHVEVLSCVSGGSIVGAHYYLLVREALQSKEQLAREDYIQIVHDLLEQFLAGVGTNIRMRVGASLKANLKMALSTNYSRTERVGELYELQLFRRAVGPDASLLMRDLKIHPLENGVGNAEFHPHNDNAGRINKIPILVLNATSLNTGHNWQFTAAWMGEPPTAIDGRIDNNEHLQHVRYSEAERRGFASLTGVRLGQAVAASACVPGLFEPLTLENLYDNRTVRLVDGGVYDNQGIDALVENGCTHLLISDASGHMETEHDPDSGTLGVPVRSSSILQARVRLAQFKDMVARERGGLLRGLVLLHLKKDLDVEPVSPRYRRQPSSAKSQGSNLPPTGRTSYGVRKDLQTLLAGIRTDLDGFHDAEAFSLMLSGYWQADAGLLEESPGAAFRASCDTSAGREFWPFRLLEPILLRERPHPDAHSTHPRLTALLTTASQTALKTWNLSRPLKWTTTALAVLLMVLAVWRFSSSVHQIFNPNAPGPDRDLVGQSLPTGGGHAGRLASLSNPTLLLGASIIGAVVLIILKVATPAGLFLRLLRRLGMAIVWLGFVWLPTLITLLLFNRAYLRLGRLDQLRLEEHLESWTRNESAPDGDDWPTYRQRYALALKNYLRSRDE